MRGIGGLTAYQGCPVHPAHPILPIVKNGTGLCLDLVMQPGLRHVASWPVWAAVSVMSVQEVIDCAIARSTAFVDFPTPFPSPPGSGVH